MVQGRQCFESHEKSMSDSKQIIELKPETTEEGKVEYTRSKSSVPSRGSQTFSRILSAALGIGFFLLLLSFFVTIILPLIALFILWVILRDIINSFRR